MSTREIPAMGAALKAVREAAGLSQQELATKAGLSVSTVFHMEQGRKNDPQLSTVIALAEALTLTPGQLVDTLVQLAGKAKKPRSGKAK